MSRKKLFGLILIVAVAIFVVVVIVRPVTATEIHNGARTYLGPVGVWMGDIYMGFATSWFAQTYLIPPWNAFLIGFIGCGILALILWKKTPALPWQRKAASTMPSSMDMQREPAEPEHVSTTKTEKAPESSPTTAEESV